MNQNKLKMKADWMDIALHTRAPCVVNNIYWLLKIVQYTPLLCPLPICGLYSHGVLCNNAAGGYMNLYLESCSVAPQKFVAPFFLFEKRLHQIKKKFTSLGTGSK